MKIISKGDFWKFQRFLSTNKLLITSNNTDNGNNDSQYFYEDVVYRIDKRGNVELVIAMKNDYNDLSTESKSS